ncbi:MAG TPA: HepT-like ribonuclease domain-containing protein [Sphingomonas sp.]|nr:HepT-like ribonuclease domain-containing protein [Sphingomonas sp.]
MLTIDAFLQRFQQVVDLTLRKLFPKLVAALELREERVALRPVLDRLEREGLIESADWWSELNELRNRLVHEYAMAPDQRAAELNKAWSYAHGLLEQLEAIRRHLERNDD